MSYNAYTRTPALSGTTGTGLDRIISTIAGDRGLAGAIPGYQIEGGASAADGLIRLIVDAVNATGAGAGGVFTVADVVAINSWIRSDSDRYNMFLDLHGDDEGDQETGYHLVQNDGASTLYQGENFANTVADGLFHIGFEIRKGTLLNEDGNPNASLTEVAAWLTQLWTDRSTTGTGLDRIVDMIQAESGIGDDIPWSEYAAALDAANGMNGMIAQAISELGLAADGRIGTADVEAINAWIRADPGRSALFASLHGDDEEGYESGFHFVRGDGASDRLFGAKAIDSVFEGIYDVGFALQNGRFLNEDGKVSAKVTDVADALDFFYSDVSTTGTGLDFIVDSIKDDQGLIRGTKAGDIMAGARAADGLNTMLKEAIETLGLGADGLLSVEDIAAINAWIRSDAGRLAMFTQLHGDDAPGIETGFHLVQKDGGSLKFAGQKLIDTVAEGIYQAGFAIDGERFLNEDGGKGAALADVATWLNSLYLGTSAILDTNEGGTTRGTQANDAIYGRGGNDKILGDQGDDVIDGGTGNDTLRGDAGNDTLRGGLGKDVLEGGEGADSFVFDTAFGRENADRIEDFCSGIDKIVLDDAIFTALGAPGGLNASAFSMAGKALDANDRIIYDSSKGYLYYDADGVGGSQQVLFATVEDGTTIRASDFMII